MEVPLLITDNSATTPEDIWPAENEINLNLDFLYALKSKRDREGIPKSQLFEDQEINRGTKITRIGEDLNSWYMRKWLGVDPENGNPLWEVVDSETGERSVF